MATCPMCNAEVEDVDQHKNDAHPAEGGAQEGSSSGTGPATPGAEPQQ